MIDLILLAAFIAAVCIMVWTALPADSQARLAKRFWRIWIRTGEWMLKVAGAER